MYDKIQLSDSYITINNIVQNKKFIVALHKLDNYDGLFDRFTVGSNLEKGQNFELCSGDMTLSYDSIFATG